MSQLYYSGKRIVPTPFVSINKDIQDAPGGKFSTLYTITIAGTIVAYKGSPNSTGTFAVGNTDLSDEALSNDKHLGAIERKIEAIRQLFSQDGLKLEIYTDSTANSNFSTPISCYPRVRSLNFPEGQWYNVVPYTITLECDHLYGLTSLDDENFANYISSASESWDIQEGDGAHVFQLSHSVNAVGKRFYTPGATSGTLDYQPYEYARRYVSSKLGYNSGIVLNYVSGIPSTVININNYNPYNYIRTENENIPDGTYGVTESWILASGSAVETYTARLNHPAIDATISLDLSIEGTIKGLFTAQNDYATAFNNAKLEFARVQALMPARASGFASGVYFNGYTVDYNPSQGSLNYSYQFNNRPYASGTTEEYTVATRYNPEDYKTTISIDGKIIGMLTDVQTDPTIKLRNAQTQWINNVKPQLFNRIQLYSSGMFGASGFINNLRSNPISQDMTVNPVEGSVNYSYSYNNRNIDYAIEDFTVSRRFSRADANTVTVNGTIQGLDFTGSGIYTTRIQNAELAFPTDSNVFSRIQTYVTGVYVNQTPYAREVSRSPYQGSISYSYEYNGLPTPIFSGCISEVISINDVNSCKIIPEIPVPGRTTGPVLQDVRAGTARQRNIAIELVFLPYSGVPSYLNAYNQKPNTDIIINTVAPTGVQTYKVQDQENYDIYSSRYSRQTTFVWEP